MTGLVVVAGCKAAEPAGLLRSSFCVQFGYGAAAVVMGLRVRGSPEILGSTNLNPGSKHRRPDDTCRLD